jgi:carbamoyltransferase
MISGILIIFTTTFIKNNTIVANIAFYGSHNAAYVVEEDGKILMVLELERFLNYKNSGLAQYRCPKYQDITFYAEYIPKWIMNKFGIKEFENCYHLNCDVITDKRYELEKLIPSKNYKHCLHHSSHAAGCFYQSSYNEMLVFSFDGGGNDGKFNVYHCLRGESPKLLKSLLNPISNHPHIYYDLGFPYMLFGHYLKDINFQDLGTGNLVYSGKLMGLSSYGKVREEWLEHFINFYKSDPNGNDYQSKIDILGEKIGIKFDIQNRLDGEIGWDIATTSQRAFEECFLEVALPYMEEYKDLPIGITGGCGLNILLNTRLVEEFGKDVFVAPDPSDCGIALGMMLNELKPEVAYDSTYSGIGLLDMDSLADYIQNANVSFKSYNLNLEQIVNDLIDGKIIGTARGNSEHGPRALGNRSIICNPSIKEMKDILNAKVKHREWYRPFAPVVRLEDVNKYFDWNKESRWMSFCPKVKEEWKDKLAAITHIDGTARVQTVTRDQNPWLYDLLTTFESKTGIGVLLNTSFNVDGKPILSTIKDAFTILEKTQMDCLILEDYYFKKL